VQMSVLLNQARKPTGMKKKIAGGGIPKCPMPGCPFHKDIESAIKAAKSEA